MSPLSQTPFLQAPTTMKPRPVSLGWLRPAVCLALTAAAFVLGPAPAAAQATPNPPERLTYQGFLVDGNGVALGNSAPKNYDVIFRIFNHESASAPANLLWAEQQTVTVDKGYFSVLLGEGASTGEPRPGISTLFSGPTASDRFVGVTVKGLGAGGANVDILPRIRLLASPYAFLAQQAVKVVRTDNGNDLLTTSGNTVSVNGPVTANSFSGDGSALSGLNAGNIASGTLDDLRLSGNIARRTGGNTFSGNQVLNNNLGLGGSTTPGFPLTFGNVLGDKISLWGQSGNSYGFGIQGGLLQIHTDGSAGDIAFGYGSSAAMTETMRIRGSGRVEVRGGILARGGYPGGGGGNNNGYAFTGNGGDNDSGMFSDIDGHVRFVSDNNLKLSVYPSGTYAHDRLHAAAGLTIDTPNGRTAEVTAYYLRIYHPSDKNKVVDFDRINNGVRIWATGGGFGNSGDYTRQIVWDGDGNWDSSSDRKLKKNIQDAEPVLERALKVQLRRFNWKDEAEGAKKSMGVIAQELQPLFPDMIGETEDKESKEKHLTVGYADFGMIAIKALQEMKTQHDAETAALKAEVAELKAQMSDLLKATAELRRQQEKVTAAVER